MICSDFCRYYRTIHATNDHKPVVKLAEQYPMLRGRGFCVLKDVIVFDDQNVCKGYIPERGRYGN